MKRFGIVAAALVLMACTAGPAAAGDWGFSYHSGGGHHGHHGHRGYHGHHHHHHHRHYGGYYYAPPVYGPPVTYVAPPYYAPAPVYVAPPPVYIAPPPPSIGIHLGF